MWLNRKRQSTPALAISTPGNLKKSQALMSARKKCVPPPGPLIYSIEGKSLAVDGAVFIDNFGHRFGIRDMHINAEYQNGYKNWIQDTDMDTIYMKYIQKSHISLIDCKPNCFLKNTSTWKGAYLISNVNVE